MPMRQGLLLGMDTWIIVSIYCEGRSVCSCRSSQAAKIWASDGQHTTATSHGHPINDGVCHLLGGGSPANVRCQQLLKATMSVAACMRAARMPLD